MFKSLQDYIAHLNATSREFPLKIMGARRTNGNRSVFLSATMLADVFANTENPDVGTPASAPFGKISRSGTTLDQTAVFSKVIPPSTGLNLFQGDVVELDISSGSQGFVPPQKYAMLISHSCDIGNGAAVTVCPIYRDSELTQGVIDYFAGRPSNSPMVFHARKQAMLRNEVVRMVSLPAKDQRPGDTSSIDDPFVVALALATTVPRAAVQAAPLILRLSYRGLSFLQWRIGTLFLRDVQDSDETRDY